MQFKQNGNVPELYEAIDTGDAAPGTLLYLLPKGFLSPPPIITFAGSWSSFPGVYIFLEQALAPGTQAVFAASAWAYLADPRMKGTRFVWFDPPNSSGLLSGTPVAVFEQTPGHIATAFAATFQFRSVGLFIASGTAVAQDMANSAFTFTQAQPGKIYLTSAWGGVQINGVRSAITVPFTGKLSGCVQFALSLSQQNLTDLDAGLRYFYAMPQAAPNQNATAQDGSFFLESLRYPIFSQGLEMYANLDPLAPLAPERTFLAFNGSDAGVPAAPVAAQVGSYYNSTLGDAMMMRPLDGNLARTAFASLVFSINQLASSPSPHDPYCLVPRGDFMLLANEAGPVQTMCGLSGVEYVALAADQNVLSFFPGNSAYAQGFAPGQSPGYTTLAPQVFPTTSFAVIAAQGTELDYMAQPDQSVLYNFTTPPPGETIFALAPVPVQAATIPWPPPGGLAFPMLPYSGVGGAHLDWYQQMESQVVSPTRRQKLTAVPPVAGRLLEQASAYSATPQGLLATYASGDVWSEIILARMAGTGRTFELTDVTGDLLSAFRSNKLFLVISDPASIASSLQAQFSKITISSQADATWEFDLNPAVDPDTHESPWTTYGTIMILKFYDMSIAELAGQTDSWAFAGTFNQTPSETASQIESIIAAASPSDADFASFLNAVNNPDWNGILMLNAQAPLSELPAQLAGLAAGISPDKFFAHHIGINASKINVPAGGGNLDISDSSIFGLINYIAPSPLEQDGSDYQFQVQQLKVLFLNSAVAAFSSVIELQVNTLFAEPANLAGSSGDLQNIMLMYGVYERHVVGTQTIESYAFQTASGQASDFDMTSNVLWAVRISQGQFVTVTSDSSSTRTESQFVFWGLLDFKALDSFDLFSFGRKQPGDPPAGLSFAKLVIEMVFDPSVIPAVSEFTFDASQISFDMAGSVARPNSFYNHFPLTVAGFTQAKDGTTPASLGYMGVQSPLTQSSVTYPWFSLNFNLNLGTPGALAAQVGFVASLTAAWSPSDASYAVFTGLRLPGSSGSKRAIQIQGLFDITFKTLEIIAIQDTNTFVLVLYNIGFKFLSFTFPPTGQVNFALFGNPDAAPGSTTLGWYLAYAKPAANSTGGTGRSGLIGRPSGPLLLDELSGDPR